MEHAAVGNPSLYNECPVKQHLHLFITFSVITLIISHLYLACFTGLNIVVVFKETSQWYLNIGLFVFCQTLVNIISCKLDLLDHQWFSIADMFGLG